MSTYAYHCQECCSDVERKFAIGKAPDYIHCECKSSARLVINAPKTLASISARRK